MHCRGGIVSVLETFDSHVVLPASLNEGHMSECVPTKCKKPTLENVGFVGLCGCVITACAITAQLRFQRMGLWAPGLR